MQTICKICNKYAKYAFQMIWVRYAQYAKKKQKNMQPICKFIEKYAHYVIEINMQNMYNNMPINMQNL